MLLVVFYFNKSTLRAIISTSIFIEINLLRPSFPHQDFQIGSKISLGYKSFLDIFENVRVRFTRPRFSHFKSGSIHHDKQSTTVHCKLLNQNGRRSERIVRHNGPEQLRNSFATLNCDLGVPTVCSFLGGRCGTWLIFDAVVDALQEHTCFFKITSHTPMRMLYTSTDTYNVLFWRN